jgi:predicted O-methyltransferase YrrM
VTYPRNVPGFRGLCWTDGAEVQALLDHLPECGRLLELGTASGVTAACIAAARPGVEVVCVDCFVPPTLTPGDADRLEAWRANAGAVAALDVSSSMRLLVGTTMDCFRRVDGRFDVILVDADHEEQACFNDLATYRHLLKPRCADPHYPGGVMAAHDYGDPNWPGVGRAVDAFMAGFGFAIVGRVGSLVLMRARA